jgi:IPT/TIG domain
METTMAGPHLDSIDPTSGPITGGLPVHIYGSLLQHVDQVTFANNDATDVKVVDSGHITCKIPSGAEGPANVKAFAHGTPSDNDLVFTYKGK